MGGSDGQTVNDHDDIPFEDILEICIVFVVHAHAVISHDSVVEQHRHYSSDERGLYRVQFVIVGIEEGERHDDLRCPEEYE